MSKYIKSTQENYCELATRALN